MLRFLEAAELPLAWGTQISAATVVVWKTVGLGFVPGYEEMFGGPGSQYPRRVVSRSEDAKWNLFYLIMYGGIGCLGQYAGLQLSLDKEERDLEDENATVDSTKNHRRVQLFGLFHTVMGFHNIAWAVNGRWGRLEREQVNVPGLGLITGMGAAYVFSQGVRLLFSTKGQITWREAIRRKTLCDATSLSTFIEIYGFMVANWFGYRNQVFEQAMWYASLIPAPILFLADFVNEQRNQGEKKQ